MACQEVPMQPTHMRAVLLTGHGDTTSLEYRSDVPVPQAGPGEVLVRVRAAAVNNTDINLRTGWYSKAAADATAPAAGARPGAADDSGWTGTPVVFPLIQGADACGEIVAAGAAVPPDRLGERVLIDPVLRVPPDFATVRYLGSDCDGTFAEYVVVPSANAVSIRSTLSDAELASFPCAYLTAENMLTRAQVADGETVLVTGASGGVGTAAVQLARRRGARVIAVAGAEKAAAIRRLGAAEVIARGEDLAARLGDGSIDVVIDVVGGSSIAARLQVLRHGGRYAIAGAIGGAIVAIDLRTLYLKDLTLYGCTIAKPGVFANLVGYIQKGEISPVVARTFALRDLAAAQEAFVSKQHVGKIVVVP
jgi:NADPH:quinone reductase-like Zn-dependent oxidoreductase